MIPIDSSNPFPLMKLDSYTYKEAQIHAEQVDKLLGFDTDSVEERIRQRSKSQQRIGTQQNWEHLSVQAMQTPYVELRNILDLLKPEPQSHIVDLGCAYGRMGFVLGAHYPAVRFTGYELEELRVSEAQRVLSAFHYPLVQVFQQDLTAELFQLPVADIYFIFDFGTPEAIRKTLHDLQQVARQRPIQVVARGKLVRFWIHQEHPWLGAVNEPSHFDHFSIYQS